MPAPLTIGMSVPGASGLIGSIGDQVASETEEQRKKRLLAMQQSEKQPGASSLIGSGYGAAIAGQ